MVYTEQEMQQVVAAYGPAVYRFAMALLRNEAAAEDAYRDVFLRWLRTAPEFQSEAHQKAWLLHITALCCKEQGKIDGSTPLSGLDEAAAKLSLRQRALLHLYYYEGYQSEEIAAMMDSKPAAIRAQLNRIRAKLKDYITEGEDEIV